MTRLTAAALAGLALLAACADAQSHDAPAKAPQSAAPNAAMTGAQDAQDPLLRPIAEEYAKRWLGEVPPMRIHGNTWYVGFEGLSVTVIRTSEGLILVDGGVPQAVRAIEANLRAIGLNIHDVKYILSTEPHYDHAGGLAALARDSGAAVVASPEAAAVLAQGRSGDDDPQASMLAPFPAVTRLHPMRDGETLTLGDVTLTAHATPGHTPGSMSWSWRSCEGDDCRAVVAVSSLNPISSDGYRFTAPANRAIHDGFVRTFAKVRALPCDILIPSHPGQAGLEAAMARSRAGAQPNPFIDPNACRAYADDFEARFNARLARERAGTEP